MGVVFGLGLWAGLLEPLVVVANVRLGADDRVEVIENCAQLFRAFWSFADDHKVRRVG